MTPPETYFGPQTWSSDVREVVERFYAALRDRELAALGELIDDRFAPGVVVREPESLPLGGSHRGPIAVKQLLAKLVATDSPVDVARLSVEEIIESVRESDQLDHVVVALTVPWRERNAAPALAWWMFEDLRVAEIRTFHWDLGS